MTDFTMDDLNDVIEMMNNLEQPMIDSFTKLFSDNDMDIEKHILVMPKEFESLFIVPRGLRKTIVFSRYIDKLIFVKKNKEAMFDLNTSYPYQVINCRDWIL